jgi:AraC family transcriptional regulator, transcriptional activator of pobA
MTKNLHIGNRKAAPVTVPKVRLYVERPEQQGIWFVNVGHVTKRGHWRTEPHAHPAYGQVIFVREGRGVMNLEGSAVPFEGPSAILLPPECVHGLEYEDDIDKWVITIDVTYLAQVNARLPEFVQLWSSPRVISLSGDAEIAVELQSLIKRLAQENSSKTVGHVVGTEALLTSLLLILVRGMRCDQRDDEVVTPGATRLAERFREAIDKHFRENLTLEKYVSMMAVSPTQLRAACASATGQSPTKMIHARIITEAKRDLIFGNMSVEQIAYGLGFSDAAYFTRFFRKEVGQSPSQFRIVARQQPHRAA